MVKYFWTITFNSKVIPKPLYEEIILIPISFVIQTESVLLLHQKTL